MDPNIMKLLEEDEDESMHSGADVDAFQAALNRDIGGDASTSQPSDSGLSHDSNQTCSQEFPNWQTSQNDNANVPNQQDLENMQQQHYQEHLAVLEPKEHVSATENAQKPIDSQELNHLPSQLKQSHSDHQHGQAEPVVSLQTTRATGMQLPEKYTAPILESNKMQTPINESQFSKIQKMGNQQSIGIEQAGNIKNHGKQIPFMLLLPALKPHLDKDREMQLQTLFNKLRKNDIAKDQFVRLMRNIVGDQVLRLAVTQLQSQPGGSQSQLAQALTRQQHARMPVSASGSQYGDSSHNPPPAVQAKTDSSYPSAENNASKSREVERQPDSFGMQVNQMSSSGSTVVNQDRERSSISLQGTSKQQHLQQQQHLHFSQTNFPPIYARGSGNYHQYSGANINASGSPAKPQPHDLQMRQIPHNQNLGTSQLGGPTQPINLMSAPKLERKNSFNDANRVSSGPITDYTNKAATQQHLVSWQAPGNKEQSSTSFSSTNYVKQESLEQAPEQQYKSQLSNSSVPLTAPVEQGNAISGNISDDSSSKVGFSTAAAIASPNAVSPSITTQAETNVQSGPRMASVTSPPGVNARMPPKKPSIGQKKPLDVPGSSPPPPSKKQKVSGAFSDQSIEQLNDVTAVSGVNLREEEEQLFSGSKEDSRVSEASRRVVQEEEERLILQRAPLQKKLAEIMARCGLKNISSDVERCLSLCVEERMRGILSNLIRLSKQRVDAEKSRHRTIVTSDVRQQIMTINKKTKEEWEKKQAEAEKLQKINEPEGDNVGEGEKEKDEGRGKLVKVNKEEDDKMRTTAANVAARAAVGGDDMFSKWQLMAEQARQKRGGSEAATSGSQAVKDVNRKTTSSGKSKDNHETEKKSSATASGSVRRFGRNQQVTVPKVARSVCVKDVIAVLEREPQMTKSTLLYRLYEKMGSEAAAPE